MLSRMTLLDWAIVALPALLVLRGVSTGGVRVLLSGYFRGLLSLALAPFAIGLLMAVDRNLFDRMTVTVGLPPLGGMLVGTLVGFVIAYVLIGIVRNVLAGALDATSVGRALDRLLGIPAGLLVGICLAMAIVVAPSVYVRNYIAADRQPAAIRNSVLLPVAEAYGLPIVHRISAAINGLR